MFTPWSVVDDDELEALRNHSKLLRDSLIVGAVWTGKNSKEWDEMLRIAEMSGIPGLVDELKAIAARQTERRRIYGY